MKQICQLGFEKAINAIKDTDTVHYCHGVWNPYRIVPTAQAIESIRHSGYGADVNLDEKTGEYYVSIPSDGDMW